MDDRRHDRRPVTAIAAIDVLHHLLAPLVLEVDVDVGRFVAVGGDEPLDQQVLLGRVHVGDAQAEADDGVGRRTPALAQDRIVLRPGPVDDVVDGQEVVRIFQKLDELQFLDDGVADPAGHALRPLLPGPLESQTDQAALGCPAGRHRFVRILIFQFPQREAASVGHLEGARQRRLMAPEQPGHEGRGLQAPLGVGLQTPAGGVDGRPLADAGQDVLQRPPVGVVVKHRIGGDHRRARSPRHVGQPVETTPVVAAPQRRRRQKQVVGPGAPPGGQTRLEGRVGTIRGRNEGYHPRAQTDGLIEGQTGLGLLDAVVFGVRPGLGHDLALAQGQEPAQASVGGAVAGKDDQFRPVDEAQTGADDQGDFRLLGAHQGPDHAGQGVAVGHADGGQPQRLRLVHDLAGMRRPLQKAEVGHRPQFGVAAVPGPAHGSTPCIHHDGAGRGSPGPVQSGPY